MSEKVDDLEHELERAAADGERVCAELKAQLERAKALVRQAKAALQQAETPPERRSFASPSDDKRH